MNKHAIICGYAPEECRMKKTEEMFDFLQTKEGSMIPGSNIISFPNGVSEFFLEATLNRCINENTKTILFIHLYKKPVSDSSATFFIGGKTVISHFQNQAKEVGFDLQVIYDVYHDFISEDELCYEKV